MRPLDDVFNDLSQSAFRRRFRLGAREGDLLVTKGLPEVLAHGRRFVAERLAPPHPARDGRQTPMRGHPVFVAQHATATCCRSCLARWHGIEAGLALTGSQQTHVLDALRRWLAMQPLPAGPDQLSLF